MINLPSIHRQLLFWTALGPLLLILLFLIILTSLSWNLLMLLIPLVIAYPLVCRWRLSAIVPTLSLFGISYGFLFPSLTPDQQFWSFGIALSLLLSLLVAALCYEEIHSLLSDQQKQSDSRLKNLLFFDKKIKEQENIWNTERQEFHSTVKELKAHEDISTSRHTEALYKQLRAQFDEKDTLLEKARHELFHTQEKLEALQKEQEEKDLDGLSPREKQLEHALSTAEKEWEDEKQELQSEIDQLQEIISQISIAQR